MFTYFKVRKNMKIINGFLSEKVLKDLIKLANKEIEEACDTEIPLYQSMVDMHIKYKDNKEFNYLISKVESIASKAYDDNLKIIKCWFNITDKGSTFLGEEGWHIHEDAKVSAIYYLDKCDEDGTYFKIDDKAQKFTTKDNSIILFNSKLQHASPEYKNKRRIIIAFDLQNIGEDIDDGVTVPEDKEYDENLGN